MVYIVGFFLLILVREDTRMCSDMKACWKRHFDALGKPWVLVSYGYCFGTCHLPKHCSKERTWSETVLARGKVCYNED